MDSTYELATDAPPPMSWGEYKALVMKGWRSLLDSDASRKERSVQEFLEQHPCLIPGPFGMLGTSGHAPFPMAAISQPILAGFSEKIPDLMSIAKDSVNTYPIMIELESPHKRWFNNNGVSSSEFTQAHNQILEWKSWFSKPNNTEEFREFYRIPHVFPPVRPIYVLIYGRREEANRDADLSAKRAYLAREDERLMTYDRLRPDRNASNFLCVRRSKSGYNAISVPATLMIGPSSISYLEFIEEKEGAIRNNPNINDARKKFLIERIDYWRDWHKNKRRRIEKMGVWE